MDNRLVFAVLLVTLTWLSSGTYAQSNTTTNAPNATSPANVTSMNTTSPTNVTSMNTTSPTNATSTNGTTSTNPTAAPPLTPNTTVSVLQTNITNTGCGTQQLCAAEPSSCSPSNPSSCFFLAAKQQSGQNFDFSLAGQSDGYIAATLSTDGTLGGNDTTYVCANNNGRVVFFGALLDNGMLAIKQLNVNNVKGKVSGRTIQCTFAATVPDSTARTTSFTIGISNGTYNSTSGALGSVSTQLRSNTVNLANPNSTVTNLLTNTTSNAFVFQQSLTQALLISAGVMGLAIL